MGRGARSPGPVDVVDGGLNARHQFDSRGERRVFMVQRLGGRQLAQRGIGEARLRGALRRVRHVPTADVAQGLIDAGAPWETLGPRRSTLGH